MKKDIDSVKNYATLIQELFPFSGWNHVYLKDNSCMVFSTIESGLQALIRVTKDHLEIVTTDPALRDDLHEDIEQIGRRHDKVLTGGTLYLLSISIKDVSKMK